MEALSALAGGFQTALTPQNLLFAFFGVFLGTLIGMLPGIGPINGIAILIPITFALHINPTTMMILFAGIYYGSQYGNSISAILLNVPGTASSVATTLDGYEMSKRGRAGPALAMSAIASFVGGTLSIFGLAFLAPLLAQWAIRFGPAEYFVLIVFTFTTISALTGKYFVKGLVATGVGLMLSIIGLDPGTGVPRFTFGLLPLFDGIDFVSATIGLFAVAEVFLLLESTRRGQEVTTKVGRAMISMKEFTQSFWVMIRSSISGFLVGVLPGAGATIASFLAYSSEQRWVDKKGTFGTGDIRGVAAPEAANNAAVSGAMIPLLTLGVPGSGTTAVILAALLSLNLNPGPLFITQQPDLFWGLVASMYVGNIMLLVLNLPLVGLFIRVLLVPRWVLVNTQVTVSPGSTLKEAVAVAVLPVELASSQVMSVRAQPAGIVSTELYAPGATGTDAVSPSPSAPATSPANVNSVGSPSGSVCFSTTMSPSLVLVNTQVTVSPGSTLKVAVAVAVLPVDGVTDAASSQATSVSAHPAGTVSVELYVPGSKPPTTMVSPSAIDPAASPAKSNA